MTNGEKKTTAKPFDSGCIPLLTGGGFFLLSVFAPVMAIYGLVTGQSMTLPSQSNTGEHPWYSRVKEPGAYWLTEGLWLFFGVLSIAIWGYILWSLFRPGNKPAAPVEEPIIPKPPEGGGDVAG